MVNAVNKRIAVCILTEAVYALLLASMSGLETIQKYLALAMFIVGERFSLRLIHKLHVKA